MIRLGDGQLAAVGGSLRNGTGSDDIFRNCEFLLQIGIGIVARRRGVEVEYAKPRGGGRVRRPITLHQVWVEPKKESVSIRPKEQGATERQIVKGDQLSFRILEDEEPARTLTVSESGQIRVPYLGGVTALLLQPLCGDGLIGAHELDLGAERLGEVDGLTDRLIGGV